MDFNGINLCNLKQETVIVKGMKKWVKLRMNHKENLPWLMISSLRHEIVSNRHTCNDYYLDPHTFPSHSTQGYCCYCYIASGRNSHDAVCPMLSLASILIFWETATISDHFWFCVVPFACQRICAFYFHLSYQHVKVREFLFDTFFFLISENCWHIKHENACI